MVRYVYIDVLFLVNWVMNMLILWATSSFSGAGASMTKLSAGAAVGAGYSIVVALLPGTLLDSAVPKLAILLIMVIVSFSPRTLAECLRFASFFLTLCFSVAGAALAVGQFTGLLSHGPAWVAVLGGAALATTGLRLLADRFKRQSSLPTTVNAMVRVGDQTANLVAFVDTGNQLRDPLSGWPVIIAEMGAVECLMPDDVKAAFRSVSSADGFGLAALGATSWANRLRALPFDSIGFHNGILPGFRPDSIIVTVAGHVPVERSAVIAVYTRRLSSDSAYNALVGSEIVQSPSKER